jgi:hypothetical protein
VDGLVGDANGLDGVRDACLQGSVNQTPIAAMKAMVIMSAAALIALFTALNPPWRVITHRGNARKPSQLSAYCTKTRARNRLRVPA